MALVLVRVDCRLIHAQILESWIPQTRSDCLVVANDQIVSNELRREIMTLAVPHEIEVAFLPVEEAARALSLVRYFDRRVALLLANCPDALRIYQAGLSYKRLNLGNLPFSPLKTQVTGSVALDAKDVASLCELEAGGVVIDLRNNPSDVPPPFSEVCACFPPSA
jgi:PTS system mannose-specific IIB component